MNEMLNNLFFDNPILASYISEAAQQVDSDDDPTPEQQGQEGSGSNNIEQLAADFQQGNISQEDLINMYKSGNISKEEIQQIISAGEGGGEEGAEGEEPQSQEELLAQQIEQTNDMFVKFALYDKITELTEKLNYFKDNFNDIESSIYDRVVQLNEFLNILSSLIFSIETPVAYQMYGSILLQLTELFNEYNSKQEQEIAKEQQMRND